MKKNYETPEMEVIKLFLKDNVLQIPIGGDIKSTPAGSGNETL